MEKEKMSCRKSTKLMNKEKAGESELELNSGDRMIKIINAVVFHGRQRITRDAR